LNAAHTEFFSALYEQYLVSPDRVEPGWTAFFQGFDFGTSSYGEDIANEFAQYTNAQMANGQVPHKSQKECGVLISIEAYRTRAHLLSKTNPVRDRRVYSPDLNIQQFGLSEADMNTVFDAARHIGLEPTTLANIIFKLDRVYCQSIGLEYMYIRDPEVRKWIQGWISKNANTPTFTVEEKKKILLKLNGAVSFENFLHTKYVGQKRFSLEGGESLIPALDALIENAAEKGVEQFVMGMAHRGRLNVLANIFGKSTKDIFSEFDGKDYDDTQYFDGDVKYH